MKTNKVIKINIPNSDATSGFVKLYAHGKVGLLFDGPEQYRAVAEECFKRALDIQITVDDIKFVRAMRDSGTPETTINRILKSCSVFDEVHLGGLNLVH